MAIYTWTHISRQHLSPLGEPLDRDRGVKMGILDAKLPETAQKIKLLLKEFKIGEAIEVIQAAPESDFTEKSWAKNLFTSITRGDGGAIRQGPEEKRWHLAAALADRLSEIQLTERTCFGQRCVDLATGFGSDALFYQIVDRCKPDELGKRNREGLTVLDYALISGKPERIRRVAALEGEDGIPLAVACGDCPSATPSEECALAVLETCPQLLEQPPADHTCPAFIATRILQPSVLRFIRQKNSSLLTRHYQSCLYGNVTLTEVLLMKLLTLEGDLCQGLAVIDQLRKAGPLLFSSRETADRYLERIFHKRDLCQKRNPEEARNWDSLAERLQEALPVPTKAAVNEA